MSEQSLTDFLGSWTSAINNAIKGEILPPPTDPRILNDPNGEYLVSYLPFDNSVSEDLFGNIWEVSGNPTISDGALSVNNSDKKGSLLMPSFPLGGQDFTISFWTEMEKSSPRWSFVFALDYLTTNASMAVLKRNNGDDYNMYVRTDSGANGSKTNGTLYVGEWRYFEIDYTQSDGKLRMFCDGQNYWAQASGGVSRQNFRIRLADNSGEYGTMIGYIDEFKIYDGVAFHTTFFTPPTRA